MTRKSPTRHKVRSYRRDNGSRVREHQRGEGTKVTRKSRVVSSTTSLDKAPVYTCSDVDYIYVEMDEWKEKGWMIREMNDNEEMEYLGLSKAEYKKAWGRPHLWVAIKGTKRRVFLQPKIYDPDYDPKFEYKPHWE